MLTDDLLLVLLEFDIAVRLNQDFNEHDTVFMAAADALHKARIADALLVLQIPQLRDVDARRAGGRRREREALAHGEREEEGSSRISATIVGAGEAQASSWWPGQGRLQTGRWSQGRRWSCSDGTVNIFE